MSNIFKLIGAHTIAVCNCSFGMLSQASQPTSIFIPNASIVTEHASSSCMPECTSYSHHNSSYSRETAWVLSCRRGRGGLVFQCYSHRLYVPRNARESHVWNVQASSLRFLQNLATLASAPDLRLKIAKQTAMHRCFWHLGSHYPNNSQPIIAILVMMLPSSLCISVKMLA